MEEGDLRDQPRPRITRRKDRIKYSSKVKAVNRTSEATRNHGPRLRQPMLMLRQTPALHAVYLQIHPPYPRYAEYRPQSGLLDQRVDGQPREEERVGEGEGDEERDADAEEEDVEGEVDAGRGGGDGEEGRDA